MNISFEPKQLKLKENDNLQIQGCSRKLHPLFHGLTGNTSGYFTPVVALKYYTTRKISARIICRASRKEVTIYNKKRAADCIQKVVIALSLKEGIMLICTKLYQTLDSNICFCIDYQISLSRVSGWGSRISVTSFPFSPNTKFCRSQISARS